jgi:AcrR family transcriptional regulator
MLWVMATDTRRLPVVSGRVAEIREVALSLFAQRGYHATSMKDIGDALGIRAPSLYNHFESKQQILVEVMRGTMEQLLRDHTDALASTNDIVEQLRRATEAHVRYHARFRDEIQVGNIEIRALEEPERSRIVSLRREYSDSWEELIARGVQRRVFRVSSARLTAWAILEMGIGVARWFDPAGEMSEALLAYHYGDMALRLVGVAHASPTSVSAVE